MRKEDISKLIKTSIIQLQKERKMPFFQIPEFSVELQEKKDYGNWSANVALRLAKVIKRNPIEIAALIKEKLDALYRKRRKKIFDKIEVAPPGFINFFLSREYLLKELSQAIKEKRIYGSNKEGRGKKIIIDYSSPNIAKPFGIGHLRSTIIGQAIYNIYKFLGWKCIGDNHLGDWGTQFGKLIYQIIEKKLKNKTSKERKKILESLTIEELERLYVDFHKEAKAKPEIEKSAKEWFKKLEEGDKTAKEIWQACKKISIKEFNKIYRLLGIKIDYSLGESFYRDKTKEVLSEAIKKKLAKKSNGALIIDFPDKSLPPAVLLKSDGATTYFIRDLTAIKYRLKKWRPDLIVYEVGADQTLYFKQLFLTAELIGWAKREKFVHIAHGLIRWKHGKFSTRKGETIHLEKVLKESVKRARAIIESSHTGRGLSEKEKERVAKAVGIGAIKYNDLSQHYSRDIVFDWNKILNLKGNSGPYIQYTFARCQSVLKKAGKINFRKKGIAKKINPNDNELEILYQISKFPEIIKESAERFSPNLICNFIFELSQIYNLFYNTCPIIKAENKEKKLFRLQLTCAVKQILKTSLNILGIESPERM